MNVFVREDKIFGDFLYTVLVDGEVYHRMMLYTGPPLTPSELEDMAAYYREALDTWPDAC